MPKYLRSKCKIIVRQLKNKTHSSLLASTNEEARCITLTNESINFTKIAFATLKIHKQNFRCNRDLLVTDLTDSSHLHPILIHIALKILRFLTYAKVLKTKVHMLHYINFLYFNDLQELAKVSIIQFFALALSF